MARYPTPFLPSLLLATLLAFASVAFAQSQSYAIIVSKEVVAPGEEFNITVTSPNSLDTLLLFVAGPNNTAVNLTIVKVYTGDVVEPVAGIIVVTVDENGKAVMRVRAPEEPGTYTLDLVTPTGDVEATANFTVTTASVSVSVPSASSSTILLVLVVVAIIAAIFWLLRH